MDTGTRIVVGDLHGRVRRLDAIIDRFGEDAHYVFVGDYTDRQHDPIDAGYQVLRRVRSLPNAVALLGNHDALILAVLREAETGIADPSAVARGVPFAARNWLINGGHWADLAALRDDRELLDWFRGLDFIHRFGEVVVQHSDAPVYLRYGNSLESINVGLRRQLVEDPWNVFVALLERREFGDSAVARAYISTFPRARLLVHGHTAHWFDRPLRYCGGQFLNVDGGNFHDTGAFAAVNPAGIEMEFDPELGVFRA
ncbi:MAG: metallophosphoesterase [Candidatus Dormibacteria bacterium]